MDEADHLAEVWRSVSAYLTLNDIGRFEIASKDFRENHGEYAYAIRREDEELKYLTYKERFHCSSGDALTAKEHCVDAITPGRGILCCGGGYGFGESMPNLVFDLRRDAEKVLHEYDNKVMNSEVVVPLNYKDVFETKIVTFFNSPSFVLDAEVACSAHTLDCHGNLQSFGGAYHDVEESMEIMTTNSSYLTIFRPEEENRSLDRESRAAHTVPLPVSSCYGAAVTLPNGDILYSGGGDSPYRGSAVYDRVYLKPKHIYSVLEKPVRERSLATCQIRANHHTEIGVEAEAWDRSEGFDVCMRPFFKQDPRLREIGWNPSPQTDTPSDDEDEDEEGKSKFERNGVNVGRLTEAELRHLSDYVWSVGKVPSMRQARCGHSIVATWDEKVMVLGGYGGGQLYLDTTEVLDLGRIDAGWRQGPPLRSTRSGAAAVIASCGRVLVAGGSIDGEIPLNTAEALDPREGKWVPLASMHHKRGYCAGTMAPHNRFLVSGGICSTLFLASNGLESYDPRANKWTLLNNSTRGRPPQHAYGMDENEGESEGWGEGEGEGDVEQGGGSPGPAREWDDSYPAPLMDGFLRACHSMTHLPPIRY